MASGFIAAASSDVRHEMNTKKTTTSTKKTNVIDHRPITAPIISPRTFSRPASPDSSYSSSSTLVSASPYSHRQDSCGRLIMYEKTELDLEKVLRNLRGLFQGGEEKPLLRSSHNNPNNKNKINSSSNSSSASAKKGARDLNNNNNNNTAAANYYSSLIAPRPLSRGGAAGSESPTPISSRREENSLESHTKRIGFGMTASGKTFPNSKLPDSNNNNISNRSWSAANNKCRTSMPPSSSSNSHSNSLQVSTHSSNTALNDAASRKNKVVSSVNRVRVQSATTAPQQSPKKRYAPTNKQGDEDEPRASQKKDVFLKHVFAVNGSIVSFKSFGYENFTNWFGDESRLSKEKKPDDFFHRELDVWGFTNREITMKLFCGNKLLVEAKRCARGKLPAKKFKETIILPNHLSVESLVMVRNRCGRIIIQELPRCNVPCIDSSSNSNNNNRK